MLDILSLLALLSLNPEVHPTLGEMVACASISLDLIVLSWIHTSAVLPAILAAVFGLQGFQFSNGVCHVSHDG